MATPDYLRVIAEQTAQGKRNQNIRRSTQAARTPIEQRGVAVPSYATNPASIAGANAVNQGVMNRRQGTGGGGRASTSVTEPTGTFTSGPVSVTVDETGFDLPAEQAAPTWSVYDDPFYMQALQGAQSRFNLDRADALAGNQYEQRALQRNLDERPDIAEAQRRRLAGNYAARGMAGGRAGALTRAEAETNAREVTARTGLREQMAELNRQFTSQFGGEGTDWLGTRRGMEAQQAAIQAALSNRLAGLTTVG